MRWQWAILGLWLLAGAAVAQTVAPQGSPTGSLQAPPKGQAAKPAPPPTPPKAVPRTAVQQVAPFASPVTHPAAHTTSALGHSAPAHHPPPHRTPVVRAPHDAHAHKAVAVHEGERPAAPAKPAAAAVAPPAHPAPPPSAEPPAVPVKGSATGLPLPRWAALRSDDVNLRAGPGARYPIQWVYRRRDLPVRIEREFEVWRLVEDQDGVKGWVHEATLTGRRDFVVRGKEVPLRRAAAADAAPVALLKPGVIGRIRACAAGAAWCEVQVSDYRGWLPREVMWGVFPDEVVSN
jgi:SH3-like domain-containing protein